MLAIPFAWERGSRVPHALAGVWCAAARGERSKPCSCLLSVWTPGKGSNVDEVGEQENQARHICEHLLHSNRQVGALALSYLTNFLY